MKFILKMAKIILISIFIFILSLLPVWPNQPMVLAQSLSLSISPPILEVMIKPGKSISQEFKLINQGEDTLLTIGINSFDENGIKETKPEDRLKWLEILSANIPSDQPFLFQKGKELNILLKFAPDQNTKEQDYYQALYFTTIPQPPSQQSQSTISQTINALILINVTSEGQQKEAQISKFSLPQIIDSFEPINLDITVKNTGKTYFRPNGVVNLYGPLGKAQFKVLPQIFLVGQERNLVLEKDQNQTKIEGFFLGRYRLEVDFVLDEGSIQVKSERYFYALPWKLSIVLVAIIILIILGIKRKRKNTGKKNSS